VSRGHDRRYGHRHRRLRATLRPLVEAGPVRCAKCGKPIRPGEAWDLGHVDGDDPFTYTGPEHARCNRATAKREPELEVEVRKRPDGYFEDAAGRLYRAGLDGGYVRVSRAW
jgi:hypothetical protein